MRTTISGTYTVDTVTGDGSATMAPFSFVGGGLMTYTNLTFQAIGIGCTDCTVSATADAVVGSPAVIGAVPIGMTTFNTAGTTLGSLFPLTTDSIAGSPQTTVPLPGFNFTYNFTSLTALNVPPPVPAAVWLFGSGLVGLGGIARRRRC